MSLTIMIATIAASLLSNRVHTASCNTNSLNGKFSMDWTTTNCDVDTSSDVITLICPEKNTNNCGARASSISGYGQGLYFADIQAAPGPGAVTTFYLFSYGRNNDKTQPWNEVDIEILGDQITSTSSVIWTNWWFGDNEDDNEPITVQWDASSGYHSYGIKIDDQNIYWIFDGTVYRTEAYTEKSDFVSTVNNYGFQALISLWSDPTGSFGGDINNNGNNFPLTAYYQPIVLAQYQHTVAFKSTAHNRYIRARDDEEMDIDATAIGDWEKFKIYQDEYLDVDYIESSHDKLVTAEHDSDYNVRNRAIVPGSWESWKINYDANGVNKATIMALSFSPVRYLRARDDYELDADATTPASWEEYELTWL